MKRPVSPPPAAGREPPLWAPLTQALYDELSPRRAHELLTAVRLLDGDPATLRLAISRDRLAPWLRDGALLRLEALVHSLSGETCALALIPSDDDPPPETDTTQTLERFVAGPNSEACLRAVRAIVAGTTRTGAALFISGPTASGKTHLLRAAMTCLAEQELDGPVVYRSGEALPLEIATAIYGGDLRELREDLSTCGALLIDDLQTLAQREATQRELASLLTRFSKRHAPVIVTADRPLAELIDLGTALRDALANSNSVTLEAPEWETRVAIFLERARGWGVQLNTNVAGVLASGIGEDLHRLDVVLSLSMVLRRSEEERVDLEHARRTLAPGPLYGRSPPRCRAGGRSTTLWPAASRDPRPEPHCLTHHGTADRRLPATQPLRAIVP